MSSYDTVCYQVSFDALVMVSSTFTHQLAESIVCFISVLCAHCFLIHYSVDLHVIPR
jgi:hypothetical protein